MKQLFICLSIAFLIAIGSVTSVANADVVFSFENLEELDGNPADGTTMTRTDGTDTVQLTLVRGFAPEFIEDPDTEVNSLTGNTIAASTNISSGGTLGINNPSISNGDFEAFVGSTAGSEGSDFNPDEGVVFTFDMDVVFSEFNFVSLDGGAEFEVMVQGVPTVFTFANGTPNDDFDDPLGGLVVDAGTEVTFTAVSDTFGPDGDTQDFNIRISEFSLNVAIPEPSSIAILCLGGIPIIGRRRRVS